MSREVMLAEMREQPDVVRRLAAPTEATRAAISALDPATPRPIIFVARGSSDNAAVYGRYLFEVRNRLLTSMAAPSAVTLYNAGPRFAETTAIAISQSGKGADIVEYVRRARASGAHTFAIVNDVSSPLAQAAAHVIDCAAGEERSIPATKTVTAQMAVLACISAALSQVIDSASLAALGPALRSALALDATALGKALSHVQSASVVGRGFAYPVALELALKLKETCRLRAEPFSAADFMHGPVSVVGPDHAVLLIDVGGVSTQPALETIERVKTRGALPVLIRVGPNATALEGVPTLALRCELDEWLAPIAAVVACQVLAVAMADARGIDPSAPPGLSKVTSTR